MSEADSESVDLGPFFGEPSREVGEWLGGLANRISHYLGTLDNFADRLRSLLKQISLLSLLKGSFGSPLFRHSRV